MTNRNINNKIKRASNAFLLKINMYMEMHVLPFYNPKDIVWWFSLSGGKDSFSMALGIRNWYKERELKFTGYGFHVNQWSSYTSRFIENQLDIMPFINIDGRDFTQFRINYCKGDQAPCRKCSDIRRELNDRLLLQAPKKNSSINFLARGLHLTDTVISLLWRKSLGYNLDESFIKRGKGKPLVRLWERTFLVKPLYYVREYESQSYAETQQIQTCCCGCPACKFPSRRDIVEETIAHLFHEPMWEFSVPELNSLFIKINGVQSLSKVFAISAPGKERKKPHLPKGFETFAVKYYRQKISKNKVLKFMHVFNHSLDLDSVGRSSLYKDIFSYKSFKIPTPSLLQQGRYITHDERLMIAFLGPFWGAMRLDPQIRKRALDLQKQIFGIEIDENWRHTHKLLLEYYRRENNDSYNRKNFNFPIVSNTYNCVSCS